MVRLLEQIPEGHWSALRLERDVQLHAMVSSAGRGVERGGRYRWDGSRRGQRPFVVLQVTVAGAGRIERAGLAHRVPVGSAMVAFVPDAHEYRVDPEAGHWDFVYAVLYGQELLRLLRYLTGPEQPVIAWDPADRPEALLHELVNTLRAGRRASPFELSSRAYTLAAALLDRPAAPASGGIRRAEQYIRTHLSDALSVGVLAAVAGLSRHHFTRRFAQATGLPPVRYVREARCERAASLLGATQLSVKEIAARCGFESANYFCRVFRRSTGMSPNEYRRRRP